MNPLLLPFQVFAFPHSQKVKPWDFLWWRLVVVEVIQNQKEVGSEAAQSRKSKAEGPQQLSRIQRQEIVRKKGDRFTSVERDIFE